jgi:predicted deacylase
MIRWFLFSLGFAAVNVYAQNPSPLDTQKFIDPVLVKIHSSQSSHPSFYLSSASRSSASSAASPSKAIASSRVAQSSSASVESSVSSLVSRSSASSAMSISSVSSASVSSANVSSNHEGQTANDSDEVQSLIAPKTILGQAVYPGTFATLNWISDSIVGGFSEDTPVLVVHGKIPGMTLCLTAAVHGDELNGIEMIRRIMHSVDPQKLTGTLIGVPVANIMGFRRNSRYLPDRRDWNRYFPGNTYGSSASRLAHSFFSNVILHCDALIDIHTGSFHRSNLTQLRADLSDENVAALAQHFGSIAVLNSGGNPNSLRAAAVRAGIPAVTMEAGEPMTMQSKIVTEGTDAIMTLMSKLGMYGKKPRWRQSAPVYYRSSWVRANLGGILFSKVQLGHRVKRGDILGTVTDPITNTISNITSPYDGRVIGMALDQVVMPGFATHHIGIQSIEAMLLEEQAPLDDGIEDEDAGDEGLEDDEDMIELPSAPLPKPKN